MSTAELGLNFGFDAHILFNRGSAHQNGHKEKGDQRRPIKMNAGSNAKKHLESIARRVTRRAGNGR